ncbi:MAG TPA: deaminase [Gaiellaceae bacterium]|nr:deaminase [Gaiellaceae bacterium]
MTESPDHPEHKDVTEALNAGVHSRKRPVARKRERHFDDIAEQHEPSPRSDSNDLEELVFAFTRAQGTDLNPIKTMLARALGEAGFHVDSFSLDEVLWNKWFGTKYYEQVNYEREPLVLEIADRLRADSGDVDTVMHLGLNRIRERREAEFKCAREAGHRGVAWLVSHLVQPDEVHLLRDQFGARVFVIAVFEPESDRLANLIRRYQGSKGRSHLSRSDATWKARDVMQKYAGAIPSCRAVASAEKARFRPALQKTFPLADLFLTAQRGTQPPTATADNRGPLDERSTAKLHQLVAQIVGYPFSTPDPHETAMAHAYQARVSSSSLGRQVGAAIVSEDHDLIATGWNDVPAPGGGVYAQHYSNLPFLSTFGIESSAKVLDSRDHMLGADSTLEVGDSNSRIRFVILANLLRTLKKLDVLNADELEHRVDESGLSHEEMLARVSGLLNDQRLVEMLDKRGLLSQAGLQKLVDSSKDEESKREAEARAWAAALLTDPMVKKTSFSAMLEYGRSVHAEMNAITTAARLGRSVKDATLYTTTFPCHECARHIIAAGIRRVIYIEPFPKSRVFELHDDAVVDGDENDEPRDLDDERVGFHAFIGFSPWRHEELFSMVHRKKVDQQEALPGSQLDLPEDLWAVADWSLDSKLRPAFRASESTEPADERLERALKKAKPRHTAGE